MTTDAVPIMHVTDAGAATAWYAQLGFSQEFEHRFGPDFPAYVGLRREGAQLHLSEHEGDARPDTLVYLWVDDVDAVASLVGATVDEAPWAREIDLTDLDGNRLRIATPVPPRDVDGQLGGGTTGALLALERAMWSAATRGDRAWMDAHLSDDFTEFGYSGRAHGRAETLDLPIDTIEATLDDMAVRPLGRDAALVTYRSVHTRGPANRASIWRRADGQWRLTFHQGTPTD